MYILARAAAAVPKKPHTPPSVRNDMCKNQHLKTQLIPHSVVNAATFIPTPTDIHRKSHPCQNPITSSLKPPIYNVVLSTLAVYQPSTESASSHTLMAAIKAKPDHPHRKYLQILVMAPGSSEDLVLGWSTCIRK